MADAINATGGSAESLALDVADKAAVKESCEALLEKHTNIDILVNNAGITKPAMTPKLTIEHRD